MFQNSVIECKELFHMANKEKIIPKFESLFKGNVEEKIEISKTKSSIIRENVRESTKWPDGILCSVILNWNKIIIIIY